MRRISIALVISTAALMGAAWLVAAPAGAQTTPLSCTVELSSNALPGPGTVTVSGTAPASTQLTLLASDSSGTHPISQFTSDPVTGRWGPIVVNLTESTTFSVQLPANYATIPCVGNASVSVARAAAALPRTGSDTKPYVWTGVALVGVGLALTVAARRRREVHNRV